MVISAQEAAIRLGSPVDRRRVYADVDGVVCFLVRWTDACSGCFEFGDYGGLASHYGYDQKRQCHVGAGCSECGYTGKRRQEAFVPVKFADVMEKSGG